MWLRKVCTIYIGVTAVASGATQVRTPPFVAVRASATHAPAFVSRWDRDLIADTVALHVQEHGLAAGGATRTLLVARRPISGNELWLAKEVYAARAEPPEYSRALFGAISRGSANVQLPAFESTLPIRFVDDEEIPAAERGQSSNRPSKWAESIEGALRIALPGYSADGMRAVIYLEEFGRGGDSGFLYYFQMEHGFWKRVQEPVTWST